MTTPIAADEHFLRIVWSPDDAVEGKVQNSAVPSDDFRGNGERGCSVDRKNLCQRIVIEAIAAKQVEKHPGNEPYVAVIANPELITIVHADTDTRLEARPDPKDAHGVIPANPAHTQVHATKLSSKSVAQKLRNEFVAKLSTIQTLDEFFGT